MRALAGKPTVKISLGTGDEKLAKQRWSLVHPQVDALVQLAELQARGPDKPDGARSVPRLDPAVIRMIAGQAYHDLLATDDRGQVEPGFVTPMAGILLRLSGGAKVAGVDGAMVAARAARTIERRLHLGRLTGRATHVLDKAIEESELDATVLNGLPAELKEGDQLGREGFEALTRGVPVGTIPSEVEQRLHENGIELPAGHPDRRALALAITRAKVRALNDLAERDRGMPIETPERPIVAPPPEPARPKPVAPLLSAMPARWISMVRPGDKQVSDNARYLRLFIGLHGDLPVDGITGAHMRAFRDALQECPRNAPKHLAIGTIAQLAAWAKANPGKPKLTRGTINHKALGALSALMEQARKDEHITANPAKGQQLPVKAADTQERRPFEPEELNTFWRSSVYQPGSCIPVAGKLWAAWWLPLLGLFTGARLEELGQALVSDVKKKDGIDYLEVTTLADDEDGDAKASGKALKTDAARRRIPLHAILIRLGFLDYVAFVRATGAKRLFPSLDEYRGRFTKNWSRWWGRWMGKLGLGDPGLTFHSFRHTFTAELRRLNCSVSVMKELLGHAQTDVTSGYGRRGGHLYELEALNEELQRISYPGLDVTHLLDSKPWRSQV